MDTHMVLKPRISEKAYGLSQASNVYVFQVPTSANKFTVASAVAAQFGVLVTSVRIVTIGGKVKRSVRKGGRQSFGTRAAMKKAYVTLKAGDTIAIFANDEDGKDAKPEVPAKSKKATRSTK